MDRARTAFDLRRYAGFVALNTAMVLGVCLWVRASNPPLRADPLSAAVIPYTVASGLVFVALYPILWRQRPGLGRAVTFYLGFLAMLVSIPTVGLILTLARQAQILDLEGLVRGFALMIAFGHIFGFVPLIGMAVVNKLVGSIFFPRPGSSV